MQLWDEAVRERVASRRERDRHVACGSDTTTNPPSTNGVERIRKHFGDMRSLMFPVSKHLWNGMNVHAPMMYLGETSVLGVMTNQTGKPKILRVERKAVQLRAFVSHTALGGLSLRSAVLSMGIEPAHAQSTISSRTQ